MVCSKDENGRNKKSLTFCESQHHRARKWKKIQRIKGFFSNGEHPLWKTPEIAVKTRICKTKQKISTLELHLYFLCTSAIYSLVTMLSSPPPPHWLNFITLS
jgi:hypothetical protein